MTAAEGRRLRGTRPASKCRKVESVSQLQQTVLDLKPCGVRVRPKGGGWNWVGYAAARQWGPCNMQTRSSDKGL